MVHARDGTRIFFTFVQQFFARGQGGLSFKYMPQGARHNDPLETLRMCQNMHFCVGLPAHACLHVAAPVSLKQKTVCMTHRNVRLHRSTRKTQGMSALWAALAVYFPAAPPPPTSTSNRTRFLTEHCPLDDRKCLVSSIHQELKFAICSITAKKKRFPPLWV